MWFVVIWNEKNMCVLKDKVSDSEKKVQEIKLHCRGWNNSLNTKKCPSFSFWDSNLLSC